MARSRSCRSSVRRTTPIRSVASLVNPPENDLARGPDGLFRLKSGQPADADPNVRVVPETLEGSNANSVDAMVSLISLARQFEMQVKMLQTADTNARSAGQILSMNR